MPRFPDQAFPIEPGCARCPGLVESRETIAWGTGPRDADVLVVGEAPGYSNPDADRWQGGNWTGMAYTSRHAGRRIRDMIDELGYTERTFFTNAVKCFPAAENEQTNREPTDAERAACRDHLLTEIETIDPAVVLPTGRHATASILEAEGRELDGFLDIVLEPLVCPDLGVHVLPIVHPSYQDVWIARLGYDPDAYLEAIGERLEALLAE